MIANINPETGVRYGVVSLNNLASWVFDEFFYGGKNITSDAAFEEWKTENPDLEDNDEAIQEFWDDYECDEEEYELVTDDGLELLLSHLGGAPLIWICKSPHIAQARECSPCVPNAGDLDSQCESGFDCYTLPPEWFDTQD